MDDSNLPPDAIGKLVAQHREFLRFLERRVGSRAEAEDLLQEAFVRGLAHADTLRDEGSVVAWFYRTLRNAVIDRHRRKGASQKALDALAREMADDVEPPREVRDVACACVQQLSSTLKPEYAEALQRIEVEGVSVKDFAEQQGITANNAAARVHRARTALRKRVMQSCGTCAEHGCVDCTCGHGGHGHC